MAFQSTKEALYIAFTCLMELFRRVSVPVVAIKTEKYRELQINTIAIYIQVYVC